MLVPYRGEINFRSWRNFLSASPRMSLCAWEYGPVGRLDPVDADGISGLERRADEAKKSAGRAYGRLAPREGEISDFEGRIT
jgi:hypothetical protein